MSTEVLAALLLTPVAILLGFIGVKTVPRAAVTIAGIVLLFVIYRLRYARR
jgi:hypothetical protein